MGKRQDLQTPDEPNALALIVALVAALRVVAGQIIVTVAYPSRVAMIDVNRRLKPEEVRAVRVPASRGAAS